MIERQIDKWMIIKQHREKERERERERERESKWGNREMEKQRYVKKSKGETRIWRDGERDEGD